MIWISIALIFTVLISNVFFGWILLKSMNASARNNETVLRFMRENQSIGGKPARLYEQELEINAHESETSGNIVRINEALGSARRRTAAIVKQRRSE